ncbi:MAG: hypothetical protein IAE93_08325 [Ignavibacteria bacterium]|nr:hypothetical protein [Ignavibacteria bacterium]
MKFNLRGNKNITSGKNTNIENYINVVDEDINDLGIIGEVFNYVYQNSKTYTSRMSQTDSLFLHVKEKIKLNFKEEDTEEVNKYFKYAYTKMHIITEKYTNLSADEQNDLQAYMFYLYSDLKSQRLESIVILRTLFKKIIPNDKEQNPSYQNISVAIVLFFFDDCTIFEKTEIESKLEKC